MAIKIILTLIAVSLGAIVNAQEASFKENHQNLATAFHGARRAPSAAFEAITLSARYDKLKRNKTAEKTRDNRNGLIALGSGITAGGAAYAFGYKLLNLGRNLEPPKEIGRSLSAYHHLQFHRSLSFFGAQLLVSTVASLTLYVVGTSIYGYLSQDHGDKTNE